MGASYWDYVVPYTEDLNQALDDLQHRVFLDHAYYFVPDDDGWPATMKELFDDEYAQESGTHSILDIDRIINAEEDDAPGTLRPLRDDERLSFFGTTKPSRGDFEQAYHRPEAPEAVRVQKLGSWWSGYCTILYANGRPAAIAIWGRSGD